MSSPEHYHSSTHSSLVGKILEQGQRLRNSMVQTILSNDPFNKDVTSNISLKKYENRTKRDTRTRDKSYKHSHHSDNTDTFPDQFYSEERILDELGIKSYDSLANTHSCNLKKTCNCDICREYNKIIHPTTDLPTPDYPNKTNLTAKPTKPLTITKPESMLKIVKNTFLENQLLLKYVDSLRVSIQTLKLNSAGKRKIMSNNSEKFENSTTYFIEYTLPDIFSRGVPKSKAKVNSGLHPKDKIRLCSKKLLNDTVIFKQHFIHGISNIELLDLSSINVEILISCRSMKQKLPEPFGKARFNLGSIITNQILTVEQDLGVVSDKAPVSLGQLRITLQFGCDRLHFGKEFIDAILSNKSQELQSGDSVFKILENEPLNSQRNIPIQNNEIYVPQNTSRSLKETARTAINDKNDTEILYAFMHVSEAELLGGPINSFLVCYGLNNDDVVNSQIIYRSSNPVFNFYQLIPLLYDENFLGQLQDRYIVIEVWEKFQDRDHLVGITKLSLHRFFVIYKNPQIASHLFKNQSPIVGLDWWESIIHTTTRKNCGQIKALVAIGTESQINNLRQSIQSRNQAGQLEKPSNPPESHREGYINIENTVYDKYVQIPEVQITASKINLTEKKTNSVDASTQSEMEENMDLISGKEFLNNFMEQVLSNKAQKNVYVANSTNDTNENNSESNRLMYTENHANKHSVTDTNKYTGRSEIDKNTEHNRNTERSQTSRNTGCPETDTNKYTGRSQTSRNTGCPETDTNKHTGRPENMGSEMDLNLHTGRPVNSQAHTGRLEISKQCPEITEGYTTSYTHTGRTETDTNNYTGRPNETQVKNTSDLLESLQKALLGGKSIEKSVDYFKAHVVIDSALHLPTRRKCKSKRNKMRGAKTNEEILPSTYVTFKSDSTSDLIVTSVVPKSTSPRWDFRFDAQLPVDFLLNGTKRLIFKVWRRASATSMQPNFQTDVVLGFAALDLTVLLSGLPNVQGWFNIVDFSSKCNGQMKIHVTPLENLSRFAKFKQISSPEKPKMEFKPSEEESPPELFNRALKRKFTELEEITQRLKQRLSTVTNDDSDMSDDFADEFERDLNTECSENEAINFEKVLNSPKNLMELAESCVSSPRVLDVINENCRDVESEPRHVSSQESLRIESLLNENEIQETTKNMDKHLSEGKHRIDSLLEKLSLITDNNKTDQRIDSLLEKLTLITDDSNSVSNRYVSGCSLNLETSENTSKSHNNNPLAQFGSNLDPDLIFNPLLFQKIFSDSLEDTPRSEDFRNVHSTTLQSLIDSSSSSTSLETNPETNISRQAPDGEGIADSN